MLNFGSIRRSDAAKAFYRVADAAYENRSVEVSSNVHPAEFDDMMPDIGKRYRQSAAA
jgi:hypothetical protein